MMEINQLSSILLSFSSLLICISLIAFINTEKALITSLCTTCSSTNTVSNQQVEIVEHLATEETFPQKLVDTKNRAEKKRFIRWRHDCDECVDSLPFAQLQQLVIEIICQCCVYRMIELCNVNVISLKDKDLFIKHQQISISMFLTSTSRFSFSKKYFLLSSPICSFWPSFRKSLSLKVGSSLA